MVLFLVRLGSSRTEEQELICTGASGITGWAITNLIAHGYPSSETFQSVTALTNRPLSAETAQWPASDKLDVVSGIDILAQGGLERELAGKVKNIKNVTHVYFFGKSRSLFNRIPMLTLQSSLHHGR